MENVVITAAAQKTQLEWTAPALWVLDVGVTAKQTTLVPDGVNSFAS